MIAYYYDNLPDTALRFAKSAVSGKSRLTVHHLYLSDTKDRIDSLIKQLPERVQIAAYYGRFCGAKRPQCEAERPGFLLI